MVAMSAICAELGVGGVSITTTLCLISPIVGFRREFYHRFGPNS